MRYGGRTYSQWALTTVTLDGALSDVYADVAIPTWATHVEIAADSPVLGLRVAGAADANPRVLWYGRALPLTAPGVLRVAALSRLPDNAGLVTALGLTAKLVLYDGPPPPPAPDGPLLWEANAAVTQVLGILGVANFDLCRMQSAGWHLLRVTLGGTFGGSTTGKLVIYGDAKTASGVLLGVTTLYGPTTIAAGGTVLVDIGGSAAPAGANVTTIRPRLQLDGGAAGGTVTVNALVQCRRG